MKYCSNCGKQLDETSNYCPSCGAHQSVEKINTPRASKKLPAIIVSLSIITLLGSCFGMIRGMFYQTFVNVFESSTLYNADYQRGYILVFLNLGTLIAAILMLNLNRVGYYLYLGFQLAYLVFTFYIMHIYSSYQTDLIGIDDGINPFILLIGSVFWLPSTLMLILYLTLVRKHFQE